MSDIDKVIEDDLLPKAASTMLILMDSDDEKIQFQAAKEVLDGTVFKKNINNNNMIINISREELTSITGVLKELSNERVSDGTFEEVGEE